MSFYHFPFVRFWRLTKKIFFDFRFSISHFFHIFASKMSYGWIFSIFQRIRKFHSIPVILSRFRFYVRSRESPAFFGWIFGKKLEKSRKWPPPTISKTAYHRDPKFCTNLGYNMEKCRVSTFQLIPFLHTGRSEIWNFDDEL